MLKEKPAEASRSITPDFPVDNYEYEVAEICALTWLGQPQNATLWLYLHFLRPDSQNHSEIKIAVALEVRQQRRRRELESKLEGHKDLFIEEWDGYGIGLRRPLKSVESLEGEATELLEEFLSCIEV
jgi:hypothetical protein